MQTPESRELERKRAQLRELEIHLVDRELALATLKVEIRSFERLYLQKVGRLWALLDAAEAEIAIVLARNAHAGSSLHAQAEEARARARQTADFLSASEGKANKGRPSETLKKKFREAARRMHPDFAHDEKDRERREQSMARVNRAYERGDESEIEEILRDWEASPDAVRGEGTAAELIRTIRQIAQAETRLLAIDHEFAELRADAVYRLKEEVDRSGEETLGAMAVEIEHRIAKAREHLERLRVTVRS